MGDTFHTPRLSYHPGWQRTIERRGLGLGRLRSEDPRDARWPAGPYLTAVLSGREGDDRAHHAEEAMQRGWRFWWPSGWWGDQGYTPQCVAYATLHALEDGPVTREPFSPGEGPVMNPKRLYDAAQERDEWPGENYDGTSARGAARYLKERGMISEYRWATTIDELTQATLCYGPVLFGSLWYSGMDRPDAAGFVRPSGYVRGGHETLVNGVNVNEGYLRLKNSWGRRWGDEGYFRLRLEDARYLLEDAGGDACLLIENHERGG